MRGVGGSVYLPTNVTVMFSAHNAVVKWLPPIVSRHRGPAAVRQCCYDIRFTTRKYAPPDMVIKATSRNVRGLTYTLDNLHPDGVYLMEVAISNPRSFQDGPWSERVFGRTLNETGVKVLMAIAGGEVVEKDLDSGTVQTVATFKDDIIDLDWHADLLFVVTVDGTVLVYNRTDQINYMLPAVQKASSVAFEWVTETVYWSEAYSYQICRSNLRGKKCEIVRKTKALFIRVNSITGQLYWTTGKTVEASRLSGKHRRTISDRRGSHFEILNLALDCDGFEVIWAETSTTQSNVRFLDPAGDERSVSFAFDISSDSGLGVYSGRMFWLTKLRTLVAKNLNDDSDYTSIVTFDPSVTAFVLEHPSMHELPADDVATFHALPSMFSPETFDVRMVEGSILRLTWPRSRAVTHGDVFYTVWMGNSSTPAECTESKCWCVLPQIDNESEPEVSIEAFSDWGTAKATRVKLQSQLNIEGLLLLLALPGGVVVERNLETGTEKTVATFPHDVKDIDWHDDLLFVVTAQGSAIVYHRSNGTEDHVQEVGHASSVAYDWLGQKVYWSVIGQNKVYRTSLTESANLETVIANTATRLVRLDPHQGRVYWSTTHTVEVATLNGEEHEVIVDWSRDQRIVVSIAVDHIARKLVWCIAHVASDQEEIYYTDLWPHDHSEIVSFSVDMDRTSGLAVFSERLFWLTQRLFLVAEDLEERKHTYLVSYRSNCTTFALEHPTLHQPLPAKIPTVNAISTTDEANSKRDKAEPTLPEDDEINEAELPPLPGRSRRDHRDPWP